MQRAPWGYGVVVVMNAIVLALTIARGAGRWLRRIYGLTATLIARTLQPLIFMHCGPIRYRAESRTRRAGAHGDPTANDAVQEVHGGRRKAGALTQILRDMVEDEERNWLVVADAVKALGAFAVGSHPAHRACGRFG